MSCPCEGMCFCCAPCCRRCQRIVADPSFCCYSNCCSTNSCWWRLCLGKNYYQPTHMHAPNNAIYVPTTAPVLPAEERYDVMMNDADDIAVFTRVPTSSAGSGYGGMATSPGGEKGQQQKVISSIGGTHAKVETPAVVKYDHIVLSQPTPSANNERSPFLPT